MLLFSVGADPSGRSTDPAAPGHAPADRGGAGWHCRHAPQPRNDRLTSAADPGSRTGLDSGAVRSAPRIHHSTLTGEGGSVQERRLPMSSNTPVKTEPRHVAPPVSWEGSFGFPLFHRLSHELDAMFDRFGFEKPLFENMPSAWTPKMEMVTRNNEFLVKVDIPGIKKEDVTLEIAGDHLILSGERKHEVREKNEGFLRTERTYGSFYRTVPLPEGVKPELAKATMHDGVLEIAMPMLKVEEKTRKLEITEPLPAKATKAA
jgi:HSP20 family protein